MFRTPPVGLSVQFFPGGVKDPHRQPMAAIVTEQGMNGMVRLSGALPGGGDLKSNTEFSRWIHDPWVKENLHALRGGSGTMPRGAWDFVPAFTAADMAAEEQSSEETSEDIDDRVGKKKGAWQRAHAMVAAGTSLDEIHRSVRGAGITRAEIEAMIEKKLQPA